MYQIIIDGPKSMKLKRLLVPSGGICHVIIRLITNYVINEIQFTRRTREGGREGEREEEMRKTEGGRNRLGVNEVKYIIQCSQKAVSGQRIFITR